MSLAYHRCGAGPPLVLVHGIGSHQEAWRPLFDLLGEQRDVIAVDLPGHGRSPMLRSGAVHDIDALTEAVERFVQDLGLQRPHVAGNSLGGGIALELARRGTVRSAVALSPIGFWTPGEIRYAAVTLRASRALARSLRPVAPRLVRSPVLRSALFGQMFARPRHLEPDAALGALRVFGAAPGFDAALPYASRYLYHGTPAVPVTVAWGAKDRLLPPRQAERARRALPSARHVRLHGCGHVPMPDDPRQVADLLLAASAD